MKRDRRDDVGRPPRRVDQGVRGAGARRLLLAPAGTAEPVEAGFRGACARDFEDFVEGADRDWTASPPPHADPDFREGLRRRLWRMQVIARGERGSIRH